MAKLKYPWWMKNVRTKISEKDGLQLLFQVRLIYKLWLLIIRSYNDFERRIKEIELIKKLNIKREK